MRAILNRMRELAISKWFSSFRRLAPWLVIPALISAVVAHQFMLSPKYCCKPWPTNAPFRPPSWMFIWRNCSLMGAFILALASLPRWQGIVGLIGVFLFLCLYGSQ